MSRSSLCTVFVDVINAFGTDYGWGFSIRIVLLVPDEEHYVYIMRERRFGMVL